VKNCDVDGIFVDGGERSHGVEKLEYSSTGRDLRSCLPVGKFRWKSADCRAPGISITFCVPQLSFGSLSRDVVKGYHVGVTCDRSLFHNSLHCNDRKD
jgi:hypothetical protein